MASLSPKAQVLAKSLTFLLLAGLAFLVGNGGLTGGVVGDVQGTNRPLGIAILAVAVVGLAALYLGFQRSAR